MCSAPRGIAATAVCRAARRPGARPASTVATAGASGSGTGSPQPQAAVRRGMFAFNLLLLALLAAAVWRVAGGWWALGTLAFLAVDPDLF